MAPAARRAQIVETATRLVSEQGFNTFNLSQVAAESGITRAGVEHHFGTKEAVLIEILRHRDEVDEVIAAPGGALPTDEAGVWRALDEQVRRNAERREIVQLYAILGAEALDPSHPAHDFFARRATVGRVTIADAARPWHPHPEGFAVEVLAIMDGLQLQWLRDPDLDLVALWRNASVLLVRR
ncbi:TetR/AcrR family transcriptional regulator [Microbacterium sp. W4I4]|uniref:TetR/AcrR family transcriptional regulator n=1 Tax=Microbacterium sp. W4I4 TaxID=3042295 RepID=UPI0027D81A9D|nr:TetR/AcrR family transcriptional regulator [Microbacterium sp. W4I4]